MELATSMNVLFDMERVTAVEAVERLAAVGFRRLDFNFVDWCYPDSPFVGSDWRRWLEAVRERAEKLGVRFTQAHGPIFDKWADTARTRWLTSLSPRSVEGAAMLNVPWIVFEPETATGPFDRAHLEALRERNLTWFDPLVDVAEREGLGLALENVTDLGGATRGTRRRYCGVTAELIGLVDAFDGDHVGICWDVGHAHIQRLDQPAALRAIGPRLKAVHIQDNNGEADQHLLPYAVPPGQGIDWPAIVAALDAIDYHGDFTLEVGGAISRYPDTLRDAALQHAHAIGTYLLRQRG
jgi:sugar phosphate isomerase/epimerase